jgi:hypothetical protein
MLIEFLILNQSCFAIVIVIVIIFTVFMSHLTLNYITLINQDLITFLCEQVCENEDLDPVNIIDKINL